MCIVGDISNKEFRALVQSVSGLVKDIEDIKDALLGTEYIKSGLVQRVEILEKDIRNFNIIRWKIIGAAAGISTVVSLVVPQVIKLFV